MKVWVLALLNSRHLFSSKLQELVCFVRMRADYHTAVGTRSQWAKELFPHDSEVVGFGAFGGGG